MDSSNGATPTNTVRPNKVSSFLRAGRGVSIASFGLQEKEDSNQMQRY